MIITRIKMKKSKVKEFFQKRTKIMIIMRMTKRIMLKKMKVMKIMMEKTMNDRINIILF